MGSDREELALDGRDQLPQVLVSGAAPEPAQERVEFVHGSVGLDPQGVLGNALTAAEAGLPLVASASVDPGDLGHAGAGVARRAS